MKNIPPGCQEVKCIKRIVLEENKSKGASQFLFSEQSISCQTSATIGVRQLRFLYSDRILKGGMLPKSKIAFLNPKQDEVVVITVDGCVFKKEDEDLRCDYALVPNEDLEIYIELKGSDIPHAVEQLESTINKLSADPRSIDKLCFIVSTRVPKQGTNIQQLQSKFKKKYNSGFRVKNLQEEFDLSSL